MKLNPENLKTLHDTAVTAAIKAGEMIRLYRSRPIEIKHKSAGNTQASQVVTEVDLRSESIIIEYLKNSFEEFDIGLLTEERGDDGSRLKKDYFWCVDPIDGTLSFIEGVPGYAVSIALVSSSGEALLGVVYDPLNNQLYSAISGQGGWRNDTAWQPSVMSSDNTQPLTLVCDRSLEQKSFYPELLAQLEANAIDSGFSGLKTLHNGGAVMNACWVLENAPACYFKIPKPQQGGGSLWDFAATTCLFVEMDAVVTDFNGHKLPLNQQASTFMNHCGVMFASDKRLADIARKSVGN